MSYLSLPQLYSPKQLWASLFFFVNLPEASAYQALHLALRTWLKVPVLPSRGSTSDEDWMNHGLLYTVGAVLRSGTGSWWRCCPTRRTAFLTPPPPNQLQQTASGLNFLEWILVCRGFIFVTFYYYLLFWTVAGMWQEGGKSFVSGCTPVFSHLSPILGARV